MKRDKSKAISPRRVVPPDPDGLNEKCAERARKVLDFSLEIPGSESHTAVRDLLYEIMHLCDRDLSLGTFEEELEWAFYFYEYTTQDD